MKNTFTFILVFVLHIGTWAQSPESFSYQAIVRNTSNQVVANQEVGLQISILQGTAEGSAVYVETHAVQTNASGLMSLEIGKGTPLEGSFTAINWGNGPYFVETEIDPDGGSNYSIFGVSQLLSVPYALYAKTAEAIEGGITETDPVFESSVASDITQTDISKWNEVITDTKLTETEVDDFVSNNGFITSEVDGSITNELQDLSLTGNNLTITNNGNATTIDLSPYVDTNTQLTEVEVDDFVSNNGFITSEVDGSITNELQDLSLTGNNLTITNNENATTIDLSPYVDTNTQLSEAEVDDFVSNNGFITSEVDGSVTNELELPLQDGQAGRFLATNGTSPYWGDMGVSDNSVDGTDIALGSDAEGDLMYYDGTNWIRLAKGDDGQALTLVNGVPSWVDKPIVSDESGGLKIIRGTVNANGDIVQGTGFSISKSSEGDYHIAFTSYFSIAPTCVATIANGPLTNDAIVAAVDTMQSSGFNVTTYSDEFGLKDIKFSFIAIGTE